MVSERGGGEGSGVIQTGPLFYPRVRNRIIKWTRE